MSGTSQRKRFHRTKSHGNLADVARHGPAVVNAKRPGASPVITDVDSAVIAQSETDPLYIGRAEITGSGTVSQQAVRAVHLAARSRTVRKPVTAVADDQVIGDRQVRRRTADGDAPHASGVETREALALRTVPAL